MQKVEYIEQNILKKLETLQFLNNGEFWNLLKQVKGSNIDKQFTDEALLPIQNLSKHYKELLRKKHNSTIKQPNESKNFENFDSLNGDITIEEIKQTIRKLKSKKASGNDSITNEMIKCSDDLILVKLEKLFNKIFQTGHYPNSWNERLIASIYKSGEKENPNNYRRITLSNSLGKLFKTILYNRLTTKLQNANIFSPAQAGFPKNIRSYLHYF